MVIGRVASVAGAAAAEASTSIDELSVGTLGAGIGMAALTCMNTVFLDKHCEVRRGVVACGERLKDDTPAFRVCG